MNQSTNSKLITEINLSKKKLETLINLKIKLTLMEMVGNINIRQKDQYKYIEYAIGIIHKELQKLTPELIKISKLNDYHVSEIIMHCIANAYTNNHFGVYIR